MSSLDIGEGALEESAERVLRLSRWFEELRDSLCEVFESLEEACPIGEEIPSRKFEIERWQREEGGGGEMGLLREGRLFEKAGVHISHVHGAVPEALARGGGGEWESAARDGATFEAAGISVILHPRNPHVPAAHMNTRHIVVRTEEGERAFFGGGADLTPMLEQYRQEDHEDVRAFHKSFKEACATHSGADYEKFKESCDRYFQLPHRGEARGMGGIFYDGWGSGDFEADFAFTRAVGESFGSAYRLIAERRMTEDWSEEEKAEQQMWRGLYAEFNLLYDRGTRFGLQTGGNVESIFSALPPAAHWR